MPNIDWSGTLIGVLMISVIIISITTYIFKLSDPKTFSYPKNDTTINVIEEYYKDKPVNDKKIRNLVDNLKQLNIEKFQNLLDHSISYNYANNNYKTCTIITTYLYNYYKKKGNNKYAQIYKDWVYRCFNSSRNEKIVEVCGKTLSLMNN